MCYRVKLESSYEEIEARAMAKMNERAMNLFRVSQEFLGFDRPRLPVVTNENPSEVQMYVWGLIPHWADPDKFQVKYTLNARSEGIHNTSSFKDYTENRCLIFVNGFYEYQWLDDEGKRKQKYYIYSADEQLLAFAGIWTRETFTILTKPAVGLVAKIHNSKMRSPIILDPMFEREWLEGNEVEFTVPDLVAVKV